MCLKPYTGICPHCGQVFPFTEDNCKDGIWTTEGEQFPSDAIVKCVYCNTVFNPFHEQCRKEHAQRRQRIKDNRPQEIKIETIVTLPGGKQQLLNREFVGAISNNDDLKRYMQSIAKPYQHLPNIDHLSNNIAKHMDKTKDDKHTRRAAIKNELIKWLYNVTLAMIIVTIITAMAVKILS